MNIFLYRVFYDYKHRSRSMFIGGELYSQTDSYSHSHDFYRPVSYSKYISGSYFINDNGDRFFASSNQ